MATKEKRDAVKELREQLRKTYQHADEVVKRITDSGVTEIPSPTLTAASR